jgi:hypothetical protein
MVSCVPTSVRSVASCVSTDIRRMDQLRASVVAANALLLAALISVSLLKASP